MRRFLQKKPAMQGCQQGRICNLEPVSIQYSVPLRSSVRTYQYPSIHHLPKHRISRRKPAIAYSYHLPLDRPKKLAFLLASSLQPALMESSYAAPQPYTALAHTSSQCIFSSRQKKQTGDQRYPLPYHNTFRSPLTPLLHLRAELQGQGQGQGHALRVVKWVSG